VELGGTLTSHPASLSSEGRLAFRVFEAMKYDAVVLGADDLLLPGLEARIAEGKVPVVSANVYKNGQRLAKPFVVVGEWTIVGLTNVPSPMAGALPYEIRDPARELESVLAAAGAAKTLVVTSMSALEARPLKAPWILCRPSAASRSAFHKAQGWIVSIGPSNESLTRVRLGSPPGIETLVVSGERDAGILEIFKEFGVRKDAEPPAVEAAKTPESIATLGPGVPVRLNASAKNKVAEFTARSLVVKDGRATVRLRIENTAPLTKTDAGMLPTTYVIPDLSLNLYLVQGGRTSVAPTETTFPRPISLKDLGDQLEGDVTFPVSPDVQPPLELIYFDFAFGHVRIPLAGRPPRGPVSYLAAPKRNKHLELGVVSLRSEGGRVVVEINGTSVAAGSLVNMSMGEYAWLIEDGVYARSPVDGTFRGMVRFVPEGFPNTGTLIFQVPEKHGKLVLGFYPKEGGPIELDLTPGVKAAEPDVKPLHVIQDGGVLEVSIAGIRATPGRVVLDVIARAPKSDEIVQVAEQFLLNGAKRVAAELAHPAPDLLKVPAGQKRRFEIAFDVAADAAELKLEYRGFTKAELVRLAGGESPANCKCGAAVEPTDKFCAGCGAKLK
jgi:hypothetical protein